MSKKDDQQRCFCKTHICRGLLASSKTVQRHAKDDLKEATKNICTLKERANQYSFVRYNIDEEIYKTHSA